MRGFRFILALGLAASILALALPTAGALVPSCSIMPGRTLPIQHIHCGTMPSDSGVPGGACDVSFNPQPEPPADPLASIGCFVASGRVGVGCAVMFNPQPDPPGDWCVVRGL